MHETLDRMYLEYSEITTMRTRREKTIIDLVKEAYEIIHRTFDDMPLRGDVADRAQEFCERFRVESKGF